MKRSQEEVIALTAEVLEVRTAIDKVIIGRETEPVFHAFLELLSRLLITADDPLRALGSAVMTISFYMRRMGGVQMTTVEVEPAEAPEEDENARSPRAQPLN